MIRIISKLLLINIFAHNRRLIALLTHDFCKKSLLGCIRLPTWIKYQKIPVSLFDNLFFDWLVRQRFKSYHIRPVFLFRKYHLSISCHFEDRLLIISSFIDLKKDWLAWALHVSHLWWVTFTPTSHRCTIIICFLTVSWFLFRIAAA